MLWIEKGVRTPMVYTYLTLGRSIVQSSVLVVQSGVPIWFYTVSSSGSLNPKVRGLRFRVWLRVQRILVWALRFRVLLGWGSSGLSFRLGV